MLYSQIANQPKEMQEKLYVWKSWNLMSGPGLMEVKSIAIDSPLVKVIKILYKHYFDQHSDKNFYYNRFFEGIAMYPNGIISMELITFYRTLLHETNRNQYVLKHRDFPLLSQYGLPPSDMDLTDRWAKKKFIWFTLAYNAHQELECFDSLENYQAAMLIKDAVSMVSVDASDVLLPIDASEVLLPVDAPDVLLPDDAPEIMPINAPEIMPVDAVDATEVLPSDASDVMSEDSIDAPNDNEVLPNDAPEMMPVDAPEIMPVDAPDVMSEDSIDAPDDNEVLPNDASDVMSEDYIDAPDDNEVLPDDNEVLPNDASDVMSKDYINALDDNEVLPNDASDVMSKDYIDAPDDVSDVMSEDSVDASEDNALQYMFLQKRYKDLQAKLLILQANKPKDQCEDQEYTQADDQGEDQEYVPDDDQEDSLDEGQQYAPDNDQEMEEEDPEKEEMDKKTALLAILNLRLIDMDRAIEPPPFPVAPRFKRCVPLPLPLPPTQLIVQPYTTKEQLIKEVKIPKNKSFSEWLPLQQYRRLLQQVNDPIFLTLVDLQEMETVDLYAFVNSIEVASNRSTNAIIRYNVMKGQAIEQLVIRAKKSRSRSRICDVYAEVNALLMRCSTENTGFVEIQTRRMQELRALGDAAEYLELDKYDYKCTMKELIDRAPQIVKEANSLKPVVEKRPAVRRRAAPAVKKQRVE
jgi:hypothetical protein